MSGSTFTLHFVVALLICTQTSVAPMTTQPDRWSDKLLLMMFDGMRWDSVNAALPGMKKMKEQGVHAQHLIPCFPTSSLPNHFCILTGLYTESHGIIENEVYDESSGETLKLKNMTHYQDSKWWSHVEPIWSVAAKQKKRVKVYHWMEAPIRANGFQLNSDQLERARGYNIHEVKYLEKAVDEALTKLAKDELDFAAVYFGDPDHTQHYHGFGSPAALKMIRDLDHVVLQLQQNSSVLTMSDGKTKLSDKLNFMLVSDHGHMNFTGDGAVNVTDALRQYSIKHLSTSGPQLSIWPKDNADEIVKELQQIPNMKVYHRKDIPERWHYRDSPYTAPVLAVVDPGYYFITPDHSKLPYSKKDNSSVLSTHGYDNTVMEMQAIFLARGPHFRKRMEADPVESIDLYQIMCAILGIQPSPNNGTVSTVRPFVVDLFNPVGMSPVAVSFNSVIITVILAVSGVLVLTGIYCGISRIKRRRITRQYRTLPSVVDPYSDNEDSDL